MIPEFLCNKKVNLSPAQKSFELCVRFYHIYLKTHVGRKTEKQRFLNSCAIKKVRKKCVKNTTKKIRKNKLTKGNKRANIDDVNTTRNDKKCRKEEAEKEGKNFKKK